MMDESLPLSWLIHDVTVVPKESQKRVDDWEYKKPDDKFFVLSHCRVDSDHSIASIPEGTAGNVNVIQGNYTLFIDAVHSSPLDRLPKEDDKVQWSDGFSNFEAVVKQVKSLYSDNGINHWEVILL